MSRQRDQQQVYEEFYDLVNMQPQELQDWLTTEESKSVGDAESGESTGHRSGRRIVEIKRTKKGNLREDDYGHMAKVNAYIKRHSAQQPEGNIRDSRWRYSLMNWGHDPLRE